MAKNKTQKRQSAGAAVAEAPADEAPTAEAESVIETNQEATPGRRLPHVGPEQFAALRDELKMTNKNISEAIYRTLARVSELTYSQGASIQTWERFETDVRAWREAHPVVEAPAAAAVAESKEEAPDADSNS